MMVSSLFLFIIFGNNSTGTKDTDWACLVVYPPDVVDSGYSIVYVNSYGRVCSTDYSKLFQNYWWLRSPNTTYGNGAGYVTSSGDVGGNNYVDEVVTNSYGRKISGFIHVL